MGAIGAAGAVQLVEIGLYLFSIVVLLTHFILVRKKKPKEILARIGRGMFIIFVLICVSCLIYAWHTGKWPSLKNIFNDGALDNSKEFELSIQALFIFLAWTVIGWAVLLPALIIKLLTRMIKPKTN